MFENELQPNKQIAYGMQTSNPNGIPMQAGIEADAIKKSVDNSYLSKRVKNSEDNAELLPAATLAVWYGLSQGMDVFNKKCNAEYEKTPMGKFGALGDKLVSSVKNSAFGKSKFGQWLGKSFTSNTQKINNLLNKSAMVRAFRNTPSVPTNKLVVPQSKGLLGWLSMDTEIVLNSFLNPAKTPLELEQYGADKKFIKDIKNAMKVKGADKYALLKEAEMKLLGIPEADIQKYIQGGKVTNPQLVDTIVKNAKIEKLGFTPKEYEVVSKDFLKNSDKVLAALEKASKNNNHMFVSRLRSDGFLGRLQNHFFGRKIGFTELYNKYLVTLGVKNPKHTTKLGRMMAKGMGLFMEGTTNRFAGGKLAVAMQAFIFGDMILNTIKAPKGEKGKTLAERFTNDFAYFLCAPFGIQLLHKFGGLQYTGMSKDEVAQYRLDKKQFNKDVMNGKYPRKGDYINARDALRDRLRGGRKNIFSKLFGRAAEIVTVGLEQERTYHKKAVQSGLFGSIKDFFTHPKYYWKNIAGYPVRFLLVMGVIMPLLATGATKIAHAIFGRPTHSVLDNDEPEEDEQTQQMDELIKQIDAAKQAEMTQSPAHHASETNLINQYMDKQTQMAAAQAQQAALNNIPQEQFQTPDSQNPYTYIPSPVSTVDGNLNNENPNNGDNELNTFDTPNTNPNEPKRRYIPNPNAIQIAAPDTTKADLALKNAETAEKLARETLSMM